MEGHRARPPFERVLDAGVDDDLRILFTRWERFAADLVSPDTGPRRHFEDAETACAGTLERGLALPAYDQCLKASHIFNLLDARGAISVTERAAYIGRVRVLAKGCCEAWLRSRGHMA